jgi:hypothetical protein
MRSVHRPLFRERHIYLGRTFYSLLQLAFSREREYSLAHSTLISRRSLILQQRRLLQVACERKATSTPRLLPDKLGKLVKRALYYFASVIAWRG